MFESDDLPERAYILGRWPGQPGRRHPVAHEEAVTSMAAGQDAMWLPSSRSFRRTQHRDGVPARLKRIRVPVRLPDTGCLQRMVLMVVEVGACSMLTRLAGLASSCRLILLRSTLLR